MGEPTEGPTLDPTNIRHLWACMVDAYGHGWTTKHGATPDEGSSGKTWAGKLLVSRITPSELSTGILAAIEQHPTWPPTLGEFVHLCRPNRPPHLRDEPRAPALPAMRSSPEFAEKHLQAAFNILGKPADPGSRRRRQRAKLEERERSSRATVEDPR